MQMVLSKTYHETGEIDPSEIHSYQIEGLGKILFHPLLFDRIDHFVRVNDEMSAYCTRNCS